ncbi:Smr domain-containing protein [Proteiniborus ethanoligenes]|uniref:Smr domain-containing protein n=1 Tax=Proteiniborus ethanoligenes TaxID=415015 RepID=A0A1H3P101_9FIRM|nr:Smr/MutS family protein [Proteiniborus ethanoligenes]SDY94720.1 Smr domain-containing protein [Proteiniborus ethanoligenes]
MRAYFVSKEHVELDLHGMTVEEAKRYLELSIVLTLDNVDEIVVIHGYRGGDALRNFVQNDFESEYVSRKYLWLNPGVTSFIIKRNIRENLKEA